MDQFDRATELEMAAREIALSKARAQAQNQEMGPERCDECDDVMHHVRRMYGYRLCVDCQTAAELRGRFGR